MWKTHLVRNTPLPKKLGRNRLGRSRSIVVSRQIPDLFTLIACLGASSREEGEENLIDDIEQYESLFDPIELDYID